MVSFQDQWKKLLTLQFLVLKNSHKICHTMSQYIFIRSYTFIHHQSTFKDQYCVKKKKKKSHKFLHPFHHGESTNLKEFMINKADVFNLFYLLRTLQHNAQTHPSGTFMLFAILMTCRHFHHLDKWRSRILEYFSPSGFEGGGGLQRHWIFICFEIIFLYKLKRKCKINRQKYNSNLKVHHIGGMHLVGKCLGGLVLTIKISSYQK